MLTVEATVPVLESAAPPLTGVAGDLHLVAQMTADFARTSDIAETLRVALKHIARRVDAEAASLFLIEPGSEDLVCRACFGPSDVVGLRLRRGQGIVWRAVLRNASELVRSALDDRDFAGHVDRSTGFVTRSILCTPLTVRDECLGAIELFNKSGCRGFDGDDLRLLQALAASAALALFNARHATEMAERRALQHELALAAEIQRAMLPAGRSDDFPIHGINLPARGVSGDFFDVVTRPDGCLVFTVGDVSGKGMNAALLMAKTASLFRCLAKRLDGPGALLAAIDAELAETNSVGMFVTMVAGWLDPATGRIVLANAGHDAPLLYHGARFVQTAAGMPPLGILPELFAAGCPESVVDLAGGTLYLFTDGLTEAEGAAGMLGLEGANRLLTRHGDRPAPDRLRAVIADVVAEDIVLNDDLTLLVVEAPRTGAGCFRSCAGDAAGLTTDLPPLTPVTPP